MLILLNSQRLYLLGYLKNKELSASARN